MTAERALVIPGPVRAGAAVRIVSPTGPSVVDLPRRARHGEDALHALGFTVTYGRHARELPDDGTRAGDPRRRAADLTEAFADPGVDFVLAADAGAFSRDIVEHLEPEVFARNPKPFVGFCDNVFLNQFLASAAGLGSLYGCALIPSLGDAPGAFPETSRGLAEALDSARPLVCTPVASRTGERVNWYTETADTPPRYRGVAGGWTWLVPGRARGPLLGGEITLLPDLIADFGLRLSSAVLFWHNAFNGPDPQRSLRRLADRTDLGGLAGMIVGPHPRIAPLRWAATVGDLLDELVPQAAYPVVVNADISHLSPTWTVPYGEEVVIDSAAGIVFPRQQTL
ncbi:LD-carboxypeptidase [Dactylosporangium sp. CA-233914]|uniref:LD-carboxypeptidase n=1 Tax=Dactylosporangium sp. CA-233914 TaxID=3239934 RepID=UPI003D8F30A9